MTIIINGYELPDHDFTRVEVRFHARTEDDVKTALTVIGSIPGVGEPVVKEHTGVVWAEAEAPGLDRCIVFMPMSPPVPRTASPAVAAAQALVDEAAIERTTEASIEGMREALAGKGSL